MTQNKNRNTQILVEEANIIEFVQKTKEGEYAPIDSSSTEYARLDAETQVIEELYIYGVK